MIIKWATLRWLFSEKHTEKNTDNKNTHPWWQVMCLTGVDYFSTLGYQPAIAFLAAGVLSPIATFVLVLVTLLGAFPVYRQVAIHSPDGEGSIKMLEKFFTGWKGKVCVLILLGFAATDFIITITLSSADATAHILENPFVPDWLQHKIFITLLMLIALSLIFLKGFKEAISFAIFTVVFFLGINIVVVVKGLIEIITHPEIVQAYQLTMHSLYRHDFFLMLGISCLFFPKLALGLSGFETGVAVMPLVKGKTQQDHIKNTHKLLLTAALIMSFYLIASSIVTSMLIPAEAFQEGGEANGRALAYLAHEFFGNIFGTVYDISTILILGFAGASAMAGLLNLVPKYLPKYGMSPEWALYTRPLVLVFTAITIFVTLMFDASVDAQAGAYATGVLVLMTSASIAVFFTFKKKIFKFYFLIISLIFTYTTVVNIIERPEGLKIALCFIIMIVSLSILSRAIRSTELRITDVEFDDEAIAFLTSDPQKTVRILAHRPNKGSTGEYTRKDFLSRERHHLGDDENLIFIEILPGDTSDFESTLKLKGVEVGQHKILRGKSPAIANAIAAILIKIHKITGKLPHAYFGWTEGHPIGYLFRFLFLGEGDVAPLTREVLRRKFPDEYKRPFIHVS